MIHRVGSAVWATTDCNVFSINASSLYAAITKTYLVSEDWYELAITRPRYLNTRT